MSFDALVPGAEAIESDDELSDVLLQSESSYVEDTQRTDVNPEDSKSRNASTSNSRVANSDPSDVEDEEDSKPKNASSSKSLVANSDLSDFEDEEVGADRSSMDSSTDFSLEPSLFHMDPPLKLIIRFFWLKTCLNYFLFLCDRSTRQNRSSHGCMLPARL